MPNLLAAAKQRPTEPGTCFLYYFSVYVNLFKELFSFVANRCISEKRVQRYRLFQYPPNISAIIFQKRWIFDIDQAGKGHAAAMRLPTQPKKRKQEADEKRKQEADKKRKHKADQIRAFHGPFKQTLESTNTHY